jgi:RHS repeat-associated protein
VNATPTPKSAAQVLPRVVLAAGLLLLAAFVPSPAWALRASTAELSVAGDVLPPAPGIGSISYDALGSATALTDQLGIVKTTYALDAWGVYRKPEQIDDSKNRFGFTGYEYAPLLNLYYANARFYDPEVGRFTSQDSFLGKIDDPPSLHRFMYAHANPTMFVDPTGHSPEFSMAYRSMTRDQQVEFDRAMSESAPAQVVIGVGEAAFGTAKHLATDRLPKAVLGAVLPPVGLYLLAKDDLAAANEVKESWKLFHNAPPGSVLSTIEEDPRAWYRTVGHSVFATQMLAWGAYEAPVMLRGVGNTSRGRGLATMVDSEAAAMPRELPEPVINLAKGADGVWEWPGFQVANNTGTGSLALSPAGPIALPQPTGPLAPLALPSGSGPLALPGAVLAPLDTRSFPTPYRQLGRTTRAALLTKLASRTITRDEWARLQWNERLANRRRAGVEAFWDEEGARLLQGLPGTRTWTPSQAQTLMQGGRLPGVFGHHTFSVSRYPHLANDPRVIYPVNFVEHMFRWHGGWFGRPSHGQPLDPTFPEQF